MKIIIIVEMPSSKKEKEQEIRTAIENAFPDYQVLLKDSDEDLFSYSLENSSINPFKDSLGRDITGELVLSKVKKILSTF